jgi:hypothetical protein
MTAWADHGAGGNGEPLATPLCPGNAGSNTTADHIETTRLTLAQLPRRLRRRVLVRADSGGGTRGFLTWLTAPSRRPRYSVGMTVAEDMQEAILKVPAASWTPACDGDGQVRDGAWVADITGLPAGSPAAAAASGCASPNDGPGPTRSPPRSQTLNRPSVWSLGPLRKFRYASVTSDRADRPVVPAKPRALGCPSRGCNPGKESGGCLGRRCRPC